MKKKLNAWRHAAAAMVALAVLGASLFAQESGGRPARRGETWEKTLKERSARGTLSDRRETVRGDSGKWNDAARLQHAPSLQGKPAELSLDDWADRVAGEKMFRATENDDNWVIFRTRQLDDNDRVWVEKIERRGNVFTIELRQAIWQGSYRKNFTYYEVVAVNLGKLDAGKYEVKWVVTPMEFRQFENPGKPRGGWPRDARAGGGEPSELSLGFVVGVRS